jgi:hypothetical protein
MESYNLSRNWFNWCFDNPDKITPTHTAVYFFAIEHCNRLGWKDKFGFPSQMAMEAIGVRSWHTYIKVFNDLVEWGFFILLEKSKNQYSSNIISLTDAYVKNNKAHDKALDKALTKHASKQQQSTHQSNDSIIKQTNNITNKQYNNVEKEFSTFSDVSENSELKNVKEREKEKSCEKKEKDTSEYSQFVDAYFEFYKNQVGVEYKFTALDGKAAKKILIYLEKVSKNKDPIESWRFILQKYDRWDHFFKIQLKLNQIESNLPNILNNIRNESGSRKNGNRQDDRFKRNADTASSVLPNLKKRKSENIHLP